MLAVSRQGWAQEANTQAQPQGQDQGQTPTEDFATPLRGAGVSAGPAPQLGVVSQAPVGGNGTRQDVLVISQGVGEVDNVNLTPDGKSQTLSMTGLDFGFQRGGENFNAKGLGDLQYLEYLQGADPGHLFGNVNGEADASMFDHRLRFTVQDNYGDQQLNALNPVMPGNLEHVNVFNAGPDLTLMPFTDLVLKLGGNYERDSYQISPFDGYKITETFSVTHLLSPVSNIGVDAELEQRRFDNTIVNVDYDRSQFYLKYQLAGARTQVQLAAGEGQVNDGPDWTHTGVGELSLQHSISSMIKVSLDAGRNLTDATNNFSALQPGAAGGIVIGPVAQSAGSYVTNYASGGVEVLGARTTIGLTARWERDVFAADPFFNASHGDYQLSLARRLTPMVTGRVYVVADRWSYINQQGAGYTNYQEGLEATVTPGRHFSFQFRYLHASQVISLAGQGYKENLIYAGVSWQPFGSPAATPANRGLAPADGALAP